MPSPQAISPTFLLWTVLVTAFLVPSCAALSATSRTANYTKGVQLTEYNAGGPILFGSNPSGRGSLNILLSCTATFGFCVWTAVHPNILPNISDSQRRRYRIILTFFAAIVPEAIVILAVIQLVDAITLRSRCRKLKDPAKVNTTFMEKVRSFFKAVNIFATQRTPPVINTTDWVTLNIAFFVAMGGFTIKIPETKSAKRTGSELTKRIERRMDAWKLNPKEENNATSSDEKASGKIHDKASAGEKSTTKKKTSGYNYQDVRFVATLTQKGFLEIYENESDRMAIFNAAEIDRILKEVDDKSKSSIIAKLFSSAQALWLAVQCLTRVYFDMRLRSVKPVLYI